jgi:hypothetical protein
MSIKCKNKYDKSENSCNQLVSVMNLTIDRQDTDKYNEYN